MKSKIAIIEQLNVLVIVFFVSSIQSLLFDIHAICSELINFYSPVFNQNNPLQMSRSTRN